LINCVHLTRIKLRNFGAASQRDNHFTINGCIEPELNCVTSAAQADVIIVSPPIHSIMKYFIPLYCLCTQPELNRVTSAGEADMI
jgi:hypothetical protein